MNRRLLVVGAAIVSLLVWPRLTRGGTNVDEQRKRLPPPAECPDDPVAGEWLAHTWEPELDRWQKTKLVIFRDASGATRLKGTIVNETWWGPESEIEPGPCDDGQPHFTVSMDADGDSAGGNILFAGKSPWRMESDVCTPYRGTYYLDRFSGQIDAAIQEFQSENNDGGTAVHLPVVFRRIRCHTDPVWREPVSPPPFEPPRGGCSCGTVAEQRQRLPPPAKCTDPVAGVWKAHTYDEMYGEWNVFTLRIHRDSADSTKLVGDISNHGWYGPASEPEPGPCAGLLRYHVSMDGIGALRGLDVEFGGTGAWRLDSVDCGSFDGGYNLDHFTGTIDPALQEFQSMNNDGGSAINVPNVFRRVDCFDDSPVHAKVEPPPFLPPSQGCGCG